jgi:hypothetical protein
VAASRPVQMRQRRPPSFGGDPTNGHMVIAAEHQGRVKGLWNASLFSEASGAPSFRQASGTIIGCTPS